MFISIQDYIQQVTYPPNGNVAFRQDHISHQFTKSQLSLILAFLDKFLGKYTGGHYSRLFGMKLAIWIPIGLWILSPSVHSQLSNMASFYPTCSTANRRAKSEFTDSLFLISFSTYSTFPWHWSWSVRPNLPTVTKQHSNNLTNSLLLIFCVN